MRDEWYQSFHLIVRKKANVMLLPTAKPGSLFMVWTISLPCTKSEFKRIFFKTKKMFSNITGKIKTRKLEQTNHLTWFRTTQLGSICASPSGSKTTVWYSLKSVSVTSAFSGQTSMVSTTVSLSKSFSHTLPTPSPGRTDTGICLVHSKQIQYFNLSRASPTI